MLVKQKREEALTPGELEQLELAIEELLETVQGQWAWLSSEAPGPPPDRCSLSEPQEAAAKEETFDEFEATLAQSVQRAEQRASAAEAEVKRVEQEQLWGEAARLVEAEELLVQVNSELAELEQSQDREAEAFQSLAVIDVDEESEEGAIDLVDLLSDSD